MAERHISGKDQFRSYFSNNVVYDDLDFKFVEEYADPVLEHYLQSLDKPKCSNDGSIASKRCTRCNVLLCEKCSNCIPNNQNDPPWPSGQNLCQECVSILHRHSESMYKVNRNKIIFFFILLGIWFYPGVIVPILVYIANRDIMATLLALGMVGVVFAVFKKGILLFFDGDFDGIFSNGVISGILMGLVVLLLKGCLYGIFAPVWMACKFILSVYYLIRMKRLMQEDYAATEDNDRVSQQYIDTYFEMVNITRALKLKEPTPDGVIHLNLLQ